MTEVYLLDVEGTCSPVSLVYERLFPFAKAHLGAFLCAHAADAEVREALVLLAGERLRDEAGVPSGDEEYLLWLMARDRKSTALKAVQGMVWREGFEAGELLGEVFEDVPEALRRWSARARVVIYSSGSVAAQRMLFGHSSAGDLTPWIAAYFDTRVGAKREAASYARIAAELGVAPGDVLFVSDVVAELDAAREVGCGTRLSLRAGNAPVEAGHGHEAVRSFEEIA